MTDFHRHFPANTKGRDFVVGDLHGSLSILEHMLKELNFNELTDRLFSVGDIVDRGPDSLGCLRLLRKSWFHAVMGNHEDMMLRAMSGEEAGLWRMNGGNWFDFLPPDERFDTKDLCIQHVQHLPFAATVDMIDGHKFHLVHAEFDDVEPINDHDLVERMPQLMEECCIDGPFPMWGRKLFAALYWRELCEVEIADIVAQMKFYRATEHFGDLSTIFSGHTPVRQPTQIGPQINLDTFGYRAYEGMEDAVLSIAEPATGKFWSSTGGPVNEVNKLVIV
jgi:hypothetical protein